MISRAKLLNEVKQLKKLTNNTKVDTLKLVPDTWSDFAKLCSIRSADGLVKFNPYPYQERVIQQVETHEYSVVCKGRQLGLSQVFINYALWLCLKTPGFMGAIISKTQKDTSLLAARLRISTESIPDYCRLTSDSLQSLTFSNNSKLLFVNSTIDCLRGVDSLGFLLIDECSFIGEHVEELFRASIPATATLNGKAKIILNSTPNMENDFYANRVFSNNGGVDVLSMIEDIRSGKKEGFQAFTDRVGHAKIFCHFKAHPVWGSDPQYLENLAKSTQLDTATIEREFNMSFSHSSESVFDSQLIKKVCTGNLPRTYNKDFSYVMGVDPAGQGKDYFCAVILAEIPEGKMEVVDFYRQKNAEMELHLFNLGEYIEKYEPIVAVEVNSLGINYWERLCLNHPDSVIEQVKTTRVSKSPMVGRALWALQSDALVLPDRDVWRNELLSFKRDGDKYEASKGKNDDLIMGLCFAVLHSNWKEPGTKFKFKPSKYKINLTGEKP